MKNEALTAAAKAMEPFFSGADKAYGEHELAAQAAITAYLNALPPISEGLEEMRLRLTTMIAPEHKGYPTHYANPDGPDAWALIEHLSAKLAEQGEGK